MSAILSYETRIYTNTEFGFTEKEHPQTCTNLRKRWRDTVRERVSQTELLGRRETFAVVGSLAVMTPNLNKISDEFIGIIVRILGAPSTVISTSATWSSSSPKIL